MRPGAGMRRKCRIGTPPRGCCLYGNPWPRCGAGSRWALQPHRPRARGVIPNRYPVPSKTQRPLNSGRWRVSGRSIEEKSHVGVFAVGENHRRTSRQDIANPGGAARAAGVAIHRAVPGRGCKSPPSRSPTLSRLQHPLTSAQGAPYELVPSPSRPTLRGTSWLPDQRSCGHPQARHRRDGDSVDLHGRKPVRGLSGTACVGARHRSSAVALFESRLCCCHT